MSIHIGAEPGDIAETVLLPGDPLRAEYVAKHYFERPVLYSRVRGMLGYTGTFQGIPVSVQGTGMGIPSAAIYVHELIRDYGVKNLIRIGSSGSLQADIGLRDVVLAMAASTDSAFNRLRFKNTDFAPTASFALFERAVDVARAQGLAVKAGNVVSSDEFYKDDPDHWDLWARYGALCVEMETAAIYTIAAKYRAHALSILTISDSLVTGDSLSPGEREVSFSDMIELALGMLVGVA